MKEYKEREKKKGVEIHDLKSHPDSFTHKEQFSLWYSKHDWLGVDKVYETSKDTIRRLSENAIDLNKYESEMVFTINIDEKVWDEECVYIGYRRIRNFLNFLGKDHIAISDGFHAIFDLKTGQTIKALL